MTRTKLKPDASRGYRDTNGPGDKHNSKHWAERQEKANEGIKLQDYEAGVNDGGGRSEGALTYSSPLAKKAGC